MGILEDLFALFGQPKTPLHVGEVMTLWAGMAASSEGRSLVMTLLNQTADPDLKHFMERYLSTLDEPITVKLTEVLRNEGIPFPPVEPDKPKSNEADVPAGAKFTDQEIANLLAMKIIAAIQLTQTGLLQVLRPDIGAMLLGFQAQLLQHGFALRNIMSERGWLKIPPYWHANKPSD